MMNTTKILESEIKNLKISSLPSRPTAPSAFGGKGYTAKDMKEAFDRLPLYIIERFNMLLSDIASVGDGSLSSEIPTGISNSHTLAKLFEDICDGSFASYLSMGDESLAQMKTRLLLEAEEINEKLSFFLGHLSDTVIDGSSPLSRSIENGEVTALD